MAYRRVRLHEDVRLALALERDGRHWQPEPETTYCDLTTRVEVKVYPAQRTPVRRPVQAPPNARTYATPDERASEAESPFMSGFHIIHSSFQHNEF